MAARYSVLLKGREWFPIRVQLNQPLLERTEFVSNDDQFLNVRSRRSLSQLYHLLFKRVEL